MQAKTICILFCCFFCFNAVAQVNADSFYSSLKTIPQYPGKIKAYISFIEKTGTQDFETALLLGKEGLQLAEQHTDFSSAGILRRQIGEAYYFNGNYNDAAVYLYSSVDLLEKREPGPDLAETYNLLGRLFRKTRDLVHARENYDKAMNIYRRLNDSAGIATIFNESGVVDEYAGDYEKAAARYSASLKIDENRKDTVGICYALSNLAGVYTLQNKFGEAESYLLRSLYFRKQMNDSFALALNYSDLGNTFFAAGDLSGAGHFLDSAEKITVAINYRELQSNVYDVLASIAEKQNNYKEAYRYYKKRSALHDSIFSFEKTRQVDQLNTKYETAKKENKIREQETRIEKQQMMIIAVLVLIFFAVLLGYAQYKRYKWRQEAETRSQILKQQEYAAKAVMEAEESERRRIAKDLHDTVGQIMSAAKMNLSAYHDRAVFSNAAEAASFENIITLVDAGCREIRSVSHNMMPSALTDKSLPAAVNEFVTRLDPHSIKVHMYSEGFEGELRSDVEAMLYRIIQECVNNVVKHSGADTLDISLIREGNEISATIEDNGKGFDTGVRLIDEGIGLKNIRTRTEYLKGSVEFKSSPGMGTLVALHVPAA